MDEAKLKNSRITKKELGLIKGGLRRTFGRSELRQRVIASAIVPGYKDPKRKAVKFWVKCETCGKMEAKSNVQVDHRQPVVPVDRSFEDMNIDEVVNRMWCEEKNLAIVCKPCHNSKTKEENKERRRLKKERNK
jgi:5-methylcytosine-specific restriction endonuclease McrA